MSRGDPSDTTNTRPTAVSRKKSGGGGGGGGGDNADPCDIDKRTILNSPNPTVLKTLKTGDILDVAVAAAPGKILQAKKGADVAGSITFPEMAQVILCIEEGEKFKAEILSISGGKCTVRVYRV
jgi:hypothetical protein